MRESISQKVANDELLTEKEADWLVRRGNTLAARTPAKPFTAEDAANSRKRQAMIREAKAEGKLEGTRDAFKNLSQDAVSVLGIAMKKLSDEAMIEDPESGDFVIDTSQIDDKTLARAMQASKYILDQAEGKATQKIEGNVEHTVTFWDKLKNDGILDLE